MRKKCFIYNIIFAQIKAYTFLQIVDTLQETGYLVILGYQILADKVSKSKLN